MSEATDMRVRGNSAPPVLRAVPTYAYSALPEYCIRLLQIMPHHDEHAPIRCQLFNYPLFGSNQDCHLYEALSYVWGPSETPRVVYVNEACLAVTENLYMALLRLRNHALPRVIWADAICINQSNLTERNSQVQLMAEIYSNASRVIVWLEETTATGHTCRDDAADGDLALESIRSAAEASYLQPQEPAHPHEKAKGRNIVLPEVCTSQTTRQRIIILLERLWFQRIWVLQEVAAARHVSIISRSRDIDGSAFCSGLEALNLAQQDPKVRSRIRSATYLIRGAVFRDRRLGGRAARLSLSVRPLGELLDMFHDRNATDPRDKVYALLGICSDEQIPDGLRPDYNISWKTLFRRLIQYLIGKQAVVETWEAKQVAVIRSNLIVLWEVLWVSGGGLMGQQPVRYWGVQASAERIQEGDFVCLLQGTRAPSIVRLQEDYCSVVVITLTPPEELEDDIFHRIAITPPREMLLIWDWEAPSTKLGQTTGLKNFEDIQIWTHTSDEIRSHAINRLEAVRLMLCDMGNDINTTEGKLRRILKIAEREQVKESLFAITAMENLAMVYRAQAHRAAYSWKVGTADDRYPRNLEAKDDILGGEKSKKLFAKAYIYGRQGRCACKSQATLVWLIEHCDEEGMVLLVGNMGEDVKITEVVVEAAARNLYTEKAIAAVLDQAGDQVAITEEAVRQASSNRGCGLGIMTRLLDRRGDQVTITEEVLKAAARNWCQGSKIITLLLDRRGDQLTTTEEVLKAAARNGWEGSEIITLLLDQKGVQVTITEGVVKAAAGNGPEILKLLFDRKGDQVTITEEVVKEAAGNEREGKKIMQLFFERRNDQVIVTEEVVKAAVCNWMAMMKLLIDERGHQVAVTEGVVQVLENDVGVWERKDTASLLLQRQRDIHIESEEVVRRLRAIMDRRG
ncbi:HET-domain-containing protein [Apiospora sp. TS-2023a]